MTDSNCTHMDQIKEVTPSADGCEECLKTGDEWVNLRLCMFCGKVGCCDNSINKHATKHWNESAHAIIKSHQPGESWMWCYADEMGLD
ncbi:MAG: UBP-type zinc finger domain-containing protein [Chloroflexi bacterium]|nr:UBP-type zinc finger domain-containing protein [Chloroflexota bacterium]